MFLKIGRREKRVSSDRCLDVSRICQHMLVSGSFSTGLEEEAVEEEKESDANSLRELSALATAAHSYVFQLH